MTTTEETIRILRDSTEQITKVREKLANRENRTRYRLFTTKAIDELGLLDGYKLAAWQITNLEIDCREVAREFEKYHAAFRGLFNDVANIIENPDAVDPALDAEEACELWMTRALQEVTANEKIDSLVELLFNTLIALSEPIRALTASGDIDYSKLLIEKPDLHDLDSCKTYVSRLYWTLRDKRKDKIHSETQALNFILRECSVGDLYYNDCLLARKIQKDRNWAEATFKKHAKSTIKSPTPKTLKRAAKKRATKKKVLRDISRYSGM